VAVTIMETVVNSSNAALMRRIVQLENGMLPLFYHYPQIRMQFRVYEKKCHFVHFRVRDQIEAHVTANHLATQQIIM
jgi:hypothetical protein